MEGITSLNILIAGGTGLVGQVLCQKLASRGHKVSLLSRHPKEDARLKQYEWDPEKGKIDIQAIEEAEVVVNLAGAGVADRRWSSSYKKQILDSRVKSTQLLLRAIKTSANKVHTYISASATGYYGYDTGALILHETSPKGNDYLANVVADWEKEAFEAEKLGLRTVCLRTGIVLSAKGGALPQLVFPIRYGFGSAFGSGNQFFSWIDIEDLAALYVFAIEHEEVRGIYNAVAPTPITNQELTAALARQLEKPLWLPHVPKCALQVVVGELSNTLVGGNKVSSEKIRAEGFVFQSPTIEESLKRQLKMK
jgi:uncharacterized protein (TIGR01777 family)